MLRKVSNKAWRFSHTFLSLLVAVAFVAVCKISVFRSGCGVLSSGANISISAGINLGRCEGPIEFVSHWRLQEKSVFERVVTHDGDVISQP